MNSSCIDSVLCTRCGRIYEEAKGCPSTGVPAGTRWEAVPVHWRCPDCGAGKTSFESLELIYQRAYCALADF